MKQDKYYRTSDLNLATFLFAKVQDMPEVDWLEGEKKEFAFDKTKQLEELIRSYSFGDTSDKRLLVNVKFFIEAREQLLDKVKRN